MAVRLLGPALVTGNALVNELSERCPHQLPPV